MPTEYAWVIERGDSPVSEPLYYAPQTAAGWDKDNALALRLARQQDAQVIVDAYCLDDQDGVRVAEHGWG